MNQKTEIAWAAGLKVCTRCPEKGSQPLENFPFRSKIKGTRGSWCRLCQKAYAKSWYNGNEGKRQKNRTYYQENPEKFREYALFSKYGLTLEGYDILYKKQDGRCAVCKRPERSVDRWEGKIRRLQVDHCHETGRVRGLLCYRCNVLIGGLGDTVEAIERVLVYLKRKVR